MRLTEAEKKRQQRKRAKRGSKVVPVEIMDWEAWGEFLSDNHWLMGSATDHSVRDATRNYLWKVCSDHRKEKASQQLAEIRSPVNGLLDREIGPYEEWRLIKPKGLRREGVIDPEVYLSLLEARLAEKDDGMDPRVAAAMIAEGGFQIKDE